MEKPKKETEALQREPYSFSYLNAHYLIRNREQLEELFKELEEIGLSRRSAARVLRLPEDFTDDFA